MKASELRELNEEELRSREMELKDQLFKLKVKKAIGQLDNPMKLKLIKRDIARIKTILNEKRKESR